MNIFVTVLLDWSVFVFGISEPEFYSRIIYLLVYKE